MLANHRLLVPSPLGEAPDKASHSTGFKPPARKLRRKIGTILKEREIQGPRDIGWELGPGYRAMVAKKGDINHWSNTCFQHEKPPIPIVLIGYFFATSKRHHRSLFQSILRHIPTQVLTLSGGKSLGES